jgi:hypothetical protein
MNTITLVATVLTLWLVMGLGFLSKYAAFKKEGKTAYQAWATVEGLLFIASIILAPIAVAVYRGMSG